MIVIACIVGIAIACISDIRILVKIVLGGLQTICLIVTVIMERDVCAYERHARRLIGQRIVRNGRILQQIQDDGRLMSEIDLERRFMVRELHVTAMRSLYSVEQDVLDTGLSQDIENERITFSSEIGGAEYLVRCILGADGMWPPGGKGSTTPG
jgi:hypothetical protein